MIGALELDGRFARAGHAVAYLVVTLPVTVLALPAVLVLILGAALSVAGIGLPLLAAAAAACRGLERLDRRAANRWLAAQVPPLPAPVVGTGGWFRRSLQLLSDRSLWRTAAHLTLRPALVAALLVVGLAPVFALALCLDLGIGGLTGGTELDYVGPWALGPALGLVLFALAAPAAALALAALETLYRVLCVTTHALLTPRLAPGGPVREMLAESLGDRTVNVVYWLPDRERFVDESGHPVSLPEPGSGRAWTAVDRDGRRVAAIVHDAALDATPELVTAAASAASLALDNERLKADLQARVEELRVSRLRIMEAGDAARRRIERNLHDGAQQQLVALALELRVLRVRLQDPAIDDLSERLASALAELRELARGIHPAILTDRGLAPAIESLADRSTVPVETDVEVSERLPAPVEAAAYFLVAEALTNVARYAEATSARVEVRREDDDLVVLVADDGVGGVDPAAGGGLRGLEDRVATVGGTLDIDSPIGGGTRLRAGSRCRREASAPALRACRGRLRRDDRRARARRAGRRHAELLAREGRPGRRRRGADRGRHARPGLEQVLGDHPQRRRLGGTAAGRARRLPVARRVQRRADERPDRPGGRHQARRARGLDPVRRPGAGDPARGPRRYPGRLDQLRQRRVPRAGGARARGPDREPGRAGGGPAARRAPASGARCASTRRPTTRASTPAARGSGRRCARPAGARARSRSTTRTRAPRH